MHPDLRKEYARIGAERDQAGRAHDRQRFWFWVKVGCACWGWSLVGAAVAFNSLHIRASVGQFFFPDAMETAKMWMNAGILIGTGGPFATLVWAWRTADKRGYFD